MEISLLYFSDHKHFSSKPNCSVTSPFEAFDPSFFELFRLFLRSSLYKSLMKYSVKESVWLKHWSTAFMKHVFPWLKRPTFPGVRSHFEIIFPGSVMRGRLMESVPALSPPTLSGLWLWEPSGLSVSSSSVLRFKVGVHTPVADDVLIVVGISSLLREELEPNSVSLRGNARLTAFFTDLNDILLRRLFFLLLFILSASVIDLWSSLSLSSSVVVKIALRLTFRCASVSLSNTPEALIVSSSSSKTSPSDEARCLPPGIICGIIGER